MNRTTMERTVEDWVSLPYAVEILIERLSDGSWVYAALHPELPHCIGYGPTPEAATSALSSARRDWIAVALENGQTVPEPAAMTLSETA